VTTAIVIAVIAFFGIALVASQLLRLREWLRKSPPLPPPIDDQSEEN
jgi:hypothetical protein